MIRRCATFIIMFFFIAGAAYAQTPPMQGDDANAEAKEAAKAAASEWLELTDSGEFEASYDAASPKMREQVTREKWMQMGSQSEEQVGELQSRNFVGSQYRETVPQVDGGPIVMLMYQSQFESGTFREMVVTVNESDTWKVMGYQVVPPQPQGGAPGQGGGGQSGGGPGGASGGGQ